MPFVKSLVFNPLKNKPIKPSLAITYCKAILYVMGCSLVCFTVFNTRIELEIVSETNVHINPITALLNNAINVYSLK